MITDLAVFHDIGPKDERGHLGDLVGRFQPVSQGAHVLDLATCRCASLKPKLQAYDCAIGTMH